MTIDPDGPITVTAASALPVNAAARVAAGGAAATNDRPAPKRARNKLGPMWLGGTGT